MSRKSGQDDNTVRIGLIVPATPGQFELEHLEKYVRFAHRRLRLTGARPLTFARMDIMLCLSPSLKGTVK